MSCITVTSKCNFNEGYVDNFFLQSSCPLSETMASFIDAAVNLKLRGTLEQMQSELF